MLTELRIRNFAIIESVTLPLAPGFNALTGETGAGKSIIVGALGLLIGERAASDLVRTGAERATVEGVFDVSGTPAVAVALDAHGIEHEGEVLVLKREVAAGAGRARAWVNGTPVTASVLGELGQMLVTVHGQHEAHALLDEDSQRAILDAFGDATAEAAEVASAYAELQGARASMRDLERRRDDAAKRADWLRHVAREIGDARLEEGEDARLEDEARRLTHAEELRALSGEIMDVLETGDEAVLARVGHLQRTLGALQKIDPSTARLQELYDAAYYALEELNRESQGYLATVEHDPARLADVERRRDLVFRLVKKHGGTVALAVQAAREAQAELDLLDTAALDQRALEQRVTAAAAALVESAARLSKKRTVAAKRLATAVDAQLPPLGMPDGHFSVALTPRTEALAVGAESVEFRVALNLGHEARALARVASGGELARVMLALKTILARIDHVPTLIFDEVDAGIGGKTGLMVGDAMRRVAGHHQVFAITHLPQIAARAHHHIVVSKGARGGVTTADITIADGDARVREVARMLGGDAESSVSREHARELLAVASGAQGIAPEAIAEPVHSSSGASSEAAAPAKAQRPKRRV
ncbi:MAG: DNA repair protein RecN [Gemmatimonadetes bacterium]|nr:DNA repair protein RecN [Gemmatimonadota bacterium]